MRYSFLRSCWMMLYILSTVFTPAISQSGETSKWIKVRVFGGANAYGSTDWNNWNVTASLTAPAFKYSDATASSVTAALSHSTSIYDNGTTYGSGMAPAEVLRYTSGSNTARTLTFSGLAPNKTYNLELYASRNSNSGYTTAFTAGGTTVTVATFQNLANKASFVNLTPTAGGQLVVNIKNNHVYSYLNGFTLTEITSGTPGNLPPAVNAGADTAITLPTNSLTLNGTANDGDGTIASYQWSQVSGPGQATLENAATASLTASALVQGTYVFRLTATDNGNATASDDVQVIVNPAATQNAAPTANAGADTTTTLPTNSIILNGSGTDTDGSISEFIWTKLSGPAQFTIQSTNAASTGVSDLVEGTYVFQLMVTDNQGATATDEVQVVVNPAPPLTNEKWIKVRVFGGANAYGSTDWNNWNVTASLTAPAFKYSDATASSVTAALSHSTSIYDNGTTYGSGMAPAEVLRYTSGSNTARTLTFSGLAPNKTYNLELYASRNSNSGYTTAFTAGGTTVTVATFQNLANKASFVNLTPTAGGQLVVNIKNNHVYSYLNGFTLTEITSGTPGNLPPAVNAGADTAITLPTNSLTLNGTANDGDGTIASYQWSQVSGPGQATLENAATASLTASALVQGTYVFRLTATDNGNATASDDVQVIVNPAATQNAAPTANAGADTTTTLPTNSIILNGSGTDTDGTITNYQWSQVTGPGQATLTNATSPSLTASALIQGTYTFRLTVTDNSNATAFDEVNVVVKPAPAQNVAPTANAGADQTITLPTNSVTLSGGGMDSDGTITGYNWTRLSGPTQTTIQTPNAASTTVSNLVEGTYIFRLTVTDDSGATATDDVQIVVKPSTTTTSVFNPNDPVVTYNASSPPVKPATGQVGKWVRTVRVGWSTTSFKCYIYNNMAFRLKFPANYDATKSYPVLIFFHGKGEFGSVYDNEYQLYLGGQVHGNAVDGGRFNGFLLYPQSQTEFWSTASVTNVFNLIEKVMVPQGLVDPFRVYVNGLSAGGGTTWSFLRRFSKLTAAITPISSAASTFIDSVHRYKFTPIFHFQGGLDTDPHPNAARSLGNRILAVGGNYKYKEFSTRGHDAWYPAWAEADYFPFYNRAHKANPWPLYGRTEFCQGTAFTDTLGVTPGFDGYEWRRNGVLIPGATSNTLVATTFGTYDCRIRRSAVWSPWSPRPVVISAKAPTVQPTITTTGLVSRVIPAPDGSTTVPLEVPEGFASYTWQKEGSTTTLSTTRFLKASTAGNYKVKVTETNGCGSTTEFSAPFLVVNASGVNGPDAPTSLTAVAISKTAIQVSWNQSTSPAYNETGFEVYQATAAAGPYTFRGLTAADAASFTATGLTSGVVYHFRVRAVNNNAASAVVGPVSTATQVDNTPPTAPPSLRTGVITRSSVELLWNASGDDVGVTKYDVYVNGVKAHVATTNRQIVYNLVPATAYSFSVKARDAAGNASPFSNTVNATTLTGTVTQDPSMTPAHSSNYSVYINMNTDNPATGVWNNTNILPAEGSVWNNFKSYSGLSSGVNMTIEENYSGVNPNGMVTGNNSGVYPDNVMRSSYYCGPGVVARVRIDGLSLRHKYSFVFFGSRSGTGDRTSVYSIGGQKVSLNASNNTATTVQINDVVADDNGAVTFTVSLGAAATFAYLNSLVIKGYYQAPAVTQNAVSDNAIATAVLQEEDVAEDSTTAAAAAVYPNPFTSEVMLKVPLESPTPVLQVQLRNTAGHVVEAYTFRNLPRGLWQQRLPLNPHTAPGLYLIQISGLPNNKTTKLKALKLK